LVVFGAGATGCEILKNLALLGVRRVLVADDDAIEVSNLSRQFLYRPGDIGANKATTAAAAARRFNDDVDVAELERRDVWPWRDIFDDDFWAGVDLVFTALDSVEARLFVDGICVARTLPLVDCGTLGAAGSVQPAVPHVTESYGATADPGAAGGAEDLVPVCTL
ncbi:hypothetical protein AURANDRAFT_7513, partial [Aureococcus anophagefferens]